MKARKWGRIINTASAHSLVASPFKSAYVTAKHGLAGLTKTVALEVATFGITANCISPGYVWTPLVEKQIPDTMKARNMTAEQVKRDVLLAAQPTKEFVTVDEVADLAVYLASDAAKSITGANISIDGGWTADNEPWGMQLWHETLGMKNLFSAILPGRAADKKAAPSAKRINLALQGGGAHGAFTWGVLEQILSDERLIIEGVSGTSAGAVNAVMLADGLIRGGREEAQKRLADFWRAASSTGNLPAHAARGDGAAVVVHAARRRAGAGLDQCDVALFFAL